MKTNPLVTVYIPCRNYGKFLAKCVESVISQLYPHWELIIVDEASEDESASIAEGFQRRFPDKVKFLQNKSPVGLQKLANRVLELANGTYMMRLDADDWLDECALLLMVAKLESSPDAGLVYGNYFYTDPAGKVLGIERRYVLGEEDFSGHIPPHGACTLFRTRALKAVGGYSEDINAQDGWELWFKLFNRVGAVSLQVPLFYYRQHGASLSRDFKRLLTARSRIFQKIADSDEGCYKPSCIAVIPVKESYPGFEGVPFREYRGVSLLERAILSATGSARVSTVVVSSKSQKVLDFAEELERTGRVPAHSRMLRDDGDDQGSVPIHEILLQAGEYQQKRTGAYPDIVMFLSLHAVNRRADHLDDAFNIIRVTQSDSVVSVEEEREPLFTHGSLGLDLLNPGRLQDLTYDRERIYRFNGAILGTWWDVLVGVGLVGEKIAYVEMSPQDSLQVKSASMLQ